MTPFEFVFFLYAIMLSLGLTHIIGGWAMALRNASAIRWSAAQVIWTLSTLFWTTGNLNSFWMMRDASDWSAWLVLSNFLFAIVNYGLCVFVTPEIDRGEILDLPAFHDRESKRYLLAMIALLVTSVLANFAIGLFADYEHWWSDSEASVAACVATLVALRWRRRTVHVVAAAIVLAISGYFLIDSSTIVATS